MPDETPLEYVNRALAAKIVSAYLRRNEISGDQVPALISTVYEALGDLGKSPRTEPAVRMPAVSIRRSVTPNFVVCLECGWQGKMLRRHLSTAHSLSVGTYRSRWNLSAEHPMVAPSYSAQRSGMAKELGLGRGRSVSDQGSESTAFAPVLEPAPRRRGRPRTPSTPQPE